LPYAMSEGAEYSTGNAQYWIPGTYKGRDHSEDLDVDGRIIL